MARGFRKLNLILILTIALGLAALNGAVAQSGGSRPIGTVSRVMPPPPIPRGSTAIFSATLTQADQKPLGNQTLRFYLARAGGRFMWIGSATTDPSGNASIHYFISVAALPGSYTLKVVFAGQGDYAASTGYAPVTIN